MKALLALVACAAGVAATASPGVAWDGCTRGAGDVRFSAADRTSIAGHRFGSGKTFVVLVHQRNGTLCQWVPYAQRLARLGYSALAIDLRNNGDSQSRGYPANMRYGGDVAAAVRYARARGARRVFLMGASLGGSAAIDGAANARPAVDGVISVSGAADLVDAIAAVEHVSVPSLFIAGARDTDFANDARRLYAASPAADKTLDVRPGAYEHGTQLVAANAEVRNRIEAFLRSH